MKNRQDMVGRHWHEEEHKWSKGKDEKAMKRQIGSNGSLDHTDMTLPDARVANANATQATALPLMDHGAFE